MGAGSDFFLIELGSVPRGLQSSSLPDTVCCGRVTHRKMRHILSGLWLPACPLPQSAVPGGDTEVASRCAPGFAERRILDPDSSPTGLSEMPNPWLSFGLRVLSIDISL